MWVNASKEEAVKLGYKIVAIRWNDTDKGDETSPNYRSMLAGKEFNAGYEDGLFASTPPLEALRWLISEAATVSINEKKATAIDSWGHRTAGRPGTRCATGTRCTQERRRPSGSSRCARS